MIELLHQKRPGLVARLASGIPEGALVGIVLPVAGPTVLESFDAEEERVPFFPGLVARHARCHPVSAG
jgi:hypothetical protein